jgi:hypothetical protein
MRETARGGQATSEDVQQARPEQQRRTTSLNPGCKGPLLQYMTSMGSVRKGLQFSSYAVVHQQTATMKFRARGIDQQRETDTIWRLPAGAGWTLEGAPWEALLHHSVPCCVGVLGAAPSPCSRCEVRRTSRGSQPPLRQLAGC